MLFLGSHSLSPLILIQGILGRDTARGISSDGQS